MKQIFFGIPKQTSGTMIEIPFISLTRKAVLFITILMAISIFSVKFSSALDFSFNSPEKAESGNPFTASISFSATFDYDVKIFIQDENKEIISQILSNDKWKNPRFYLKSAFPAQKEFQVKAINASGNYQICARLRESGKVSFFEKCHEISITSKKQEIQSTQKTLKEANSKRTYNSSQFSNNQTAQNLIYNSDLQNQKIKLESRYSAQSGVFTTKYETTRNLILFSFTAFCIIIIILLALRQL